MQQLFSFVRYFRFKNIEDRIVYLHWYKFINKSQWWTKEENDNYQWNRIKSLLNYAYTNIPYYKELFLKISATPEDIKTWTDFRKIPYLTRDIVHERSPDLISRDIKQISKLKHYSTGGSTGQPLGFYKLRVNEAIERAFMYQQWGRVGFKEGNRRVILRGDPVENDQLFHRYRFSNNWQMSSYHLSKSNINQYVDFLNHIKPEFFHVHPSSFYVFTKLMSESKLVVNFEPKAILCGSEPVYDYQRELFEKTYNTRVYSWLGLTEGTTLAGECEYSKSLHVWPQYSYVELLDDKGLPVYEKDRVGSIIGTTLNNYITPFIRYRSGDLASFGSPQCDLCGRHHMTLANIEGREQSIILMTDGGGLPAHSIPYIIKTCNAFKQIKLMQIIQEAKDEIILRLSTTVDFSSGDEEQIRKVMKSSFSSKLSIRFEYPNDFIRSKSGKHLFFIQMIKNS